MYRVKNKPVVSPAPTPAPAVEKEPEKVVPQINVEEIISLLMEEQRKVNEELIKKLDNIQPSASVKERIEMMLAINKMNTTLEQTVVQSFNQLQNTLVNAVSSSMKEIKLPEIKLPEPKQETEFDWVHDIMYDSEDRITSIRSTKKPIKNA